MINIYKASHQEGDFSIVFKKNKTNLLRCIKINRETDKMMILIISKFIKSMHQNHLANSTPVAFTKAPVVKAAPDLLSA